MAMGPKENPLGKTTAFGRHFSFYQSAVFELPGPSWFAKVQDSDVLKTSKDGLRLRGTHSGASGDVFFLLKPTSKKVDPSMRSHVLGCVGEVPFGFFVG